MAITVTTDMKYTRPGEGTPSNVLSAHNALIWLFQDGAIAANPTAKVQIDVINTAGGIVFASDVFDAYLLDYSSPVAKFRFDATQIIKHIITNYFYKEMSNDVISPQDYGNEIQVNIVTFDNAVQEDSETIEYFGSHALNQIGDEYGANIPRIYYNDTEQIAHFLGFPNHLFFYSSSDLAAEDGFVEILETALSNIISGYINLSYDTFTSIGTAVSSAIESGGVGEAKSGTIAIIQGEYFKVTISSLVLNSGQLPLVKLHGALGQASDLIQTQTGNNVIVLRANYTDPIADFRFRNTAVSNWSCGTVLVENLGNGMESDSLGQYVHDINLGLAELSITAYQVNFYIDFVDLTLIKTYNLTIFEPCENAVYIRWLTRDGIYMYWAFTPFKVSSVEAQKIGNVINSFDEQALANSRNFPIGYKNSFDKIAVSAATVPIVFLRKLMELFISPAVYLWQGKQTPDENLISELTNAGYDTLVSDGTIIISAINTSGGTDFVFGGPIFSVANSEVITVIFSLTLNSGQLPSLFLRDQTLAQISNTAVAVEGFNKITLTATKTGSLIELYIRSSAVANFSTDKIIVKRAELETDWILLEAVEGSHNLREKKQHDNFNATLVLPENFTQTLGGFDL